MRPAREPGQVSFERGSVPALLPSTRASSSPLRSYAAFFVVVAAVVAAGFAFALALRRRVQAADALAAVPRGAWLVVTVDVAALRSSPLAQPFLATDKGPRALGDLSAACGFDPVARMRQLVLCAPENGERGDFGLAFSGDFTKGELAGCADKVIRARGGRPVSSVRGPFDVVEDANDAGHTRLAYRDGGPFLVGRGAWLDAMMDAAEQRGGGGGADHAALREAVLARRRGKPAPAFLLSALLPASLRKRLRSELGPEASGDSTSSSRAERGERAESSTNDGAQAYESVLAVQAAAIAVGTQGGRGGGSASTTDVAVELRCETADACREVRTLVESKRLALSRDFALRLVGLGPLLDSLVVDAHGAALSASAEAPTDDLARAMKRVLEWRSRNAK